MTALLAIGLILTAVKPLYLLLTLPRKTMEPQDLPPDEPTPRLPIRWTDTLPKGRLCYLVQVPDTEQASHHPISCRSREAAAFLRDLAWADGPDEGEGDKGGEGAE